MQAAELQQLATRHAAHSLVRRMATAWHTAVAAVALERQRQARHAATWDRIHGWLGERRDGVQPEEATLVSDSAGQSAAAAGAGTRSAVGAGLLTCPSPLRAARDIIARAASERGERPAQLPLRVPDPSGVQCAAWPPTVRAARENVTEAREARLLPRKEGQAATWRHASASQHVAALANDLLCRVLDIDAPRLDIAPLLDVGPALNRSHADAPRAVTHIIPIRTSLNTRSDAQPPVAAAGSSSTGNADDAAEGVAAVLWLRLLPDR